MSIELTDAERQRIDMALKYMAQYQSANRRPNRDLALIARLAGLLAPKPRRVVKKKEATS